MTSAPALIKEAKMEGADESDEVVGQLTRKKLQNVNKVAQK